MGVKKSSQQVSTPRRRFVQGLIAGGVLIDNIDAGQDRSTLNTYSGMKE
ncbi:hypothetical protein VPAL9027_01736 [Vibrio palustris]|uniref:Uncharacterized protein n=1 Tax=Vibrio palustris TaxID=1918946 RepID=A0A1R4B4B2_9VIBR|nr:hypothetical protein VPAL9027_01736 [Vibrio palustris]